jgi:hypothetical protein
MTERPGQASTPTDPDELVEVWLLGFPLDAFARAQEHADGLIREFTYIAQSREAGESEDVPARLLAIVDELTSQYGSFSIGPDAVRDAALERGESEIDLRYLVPPAAAAAAAHLGQIFDEADEYCRAGAHMLSLATPPAAVNFRRWFLAEFDAQLNGGAPTRWQQSAERGGASAR